MKHDMVFRWVFPLLFLSIFYLIVRTGNMHLLQDMYHLKSRKLGYKRVVAPEDVDAALGKIIPAAKCASKFVQLTEVYLAKDAELRGANKNISRLKAEAIVALADRKRDLAERDKEIPERRQRGLI